MRGIVDLFCGIGGFSEGARQAGHQILMAIDSDQRALEAHKQNHPGSEHVLAELPNGLPPLPRDAHWHASPPCQAVSQANRIVRSKQRQDAISLVEWYLTLVEMHGPASWSMEQVATPVTIELLEKRRRRMPKVFAYAVVNLAHYGVPQDRRRLIAGTPSLVERFLKRVSPPYSVAGAIPDSPSQFIMNSTTNTPCNSGFRRLRPEEHMRSVDRPSYTVLACNPLKWVEEDGTIMRKMTECEAAILQTFPVSYYLGGASVSSRRRGVGNALPPEAARRMVAAQF
jgi:DNA (cytosine-5)-methyltransferase 1